MQETQTAPKPIHYSLSFPNRSVTTLSKTQQYYIGDTYFTSVPKIGERSRNIASKLSTTFQERQQLHIVRRDKFIETEKDVIFNSRQSIEKTENTKANGLFTKVIPFTRSFSPPRKHPSKSIKSPTLTELEPKLKIKERSESVIFETSNKLSEKVKRPHTDDKKRKLYDSAAHDKMTILRTKANRAVNHHNIFKVKGPYKIIRRQLRQRGWIEQDYNSKYGNKSKDKTKVNTKIVDNDSTSSECDSSSDCPSDEEDYCILARAVKNALPNFIITLKTSDVDYKFLTKAQFANHFKKTGCFTTKSGLTQIFHELPWYTTSDSRDFFPRCFLLSSAADQPTFIEDFLKTAAISILKFLKASIEAGTFCSNENEHKNFAIEIVNFSLKVGSSILENIENYDLDELTPVITYDENEPLWKNLLDSFYLLKSNTIQWQNECRGLYQETVTLLNSLQRVMPQFEMDGSRNIWIVKPGAMSRGRGIKCLSRLDEILEMVSSRILLQEGKFVVQKYIENPLLIEDTKFDIRQWFLVTDWNPLTVWMYKECYVRFSGQRFSLSDFHESIHLCNNSIQVNYSVSKSRSSNLPTDNICDIEEFKQYLINITGYDVWGDELFEKAKDIVYTIMLSSSHNVDVHKGSFELYGADFMISSDLKLYLIEINSSPTMARNTVVTKRLCKQVQEDLIRFLIDENRSRFQAEKCNWILAGKGPKFNSQPPSVGICQNFTIYGKQMKS